MTTPDPDAVARAFWGVPEEGEASPALDDPDAVALRFWGASEAYSEEAPPEAPEDPARTADARARAILGLPNLEPSSTPEAAQAAADARALAAIDNLLARERAREEAPKEPPVGFSLDSARSDGETERSIAAREQALRRRLAHGTDSPGGWTRVDNLGDALGIVTNNTD